MHRQMDLESGTKQLFQMVKTGHSEAIHLFVGRFVSSKLLIATSGCKEPYFYFNEDAQLHLK